MPILTGARYAVRVLANSEGYVTSTEILDTPEAIGDIDTDNYSRFGVYQWGGASVEKSSGDIELDPAKPGEIGVSGAGFAVLLNRPDIADIGAVFVIFAPPGAEVSLLQFDDAIMSGGYVLLSGYYVTDTPPTFFLGAGGAPPGPATDFWTDLVGSREII